MSDPADSPPPAAAATPTREPALSVLVPLLDGLPLTRAMLDSLLATLPAGLDFEVLLVDDGSVDGTREWLGSLADPRLRPVLNDSNLGFAAANNRAAALARAPLLLLLNNDTLLRPGWFQPLCDALQDPAVGIAGNLQERADDGSLDHAGITVTPAGELAHLRTVRDAPVSRVLAVTGACCLLRRRDFLSVGGFDGRFVNGCEDVDLCLRLRARGLASVVANRSRIIHHVGATRGPGSLRDEANSLLLYSLWHDTLAEAFAASLLAAQPVTTRPGAGVGDPASARVLARSLLWRRQVGRLRLLAGAGRPVPDGVRPPLPDDTSGAAEPCPPVKRPWFSAKPAMGGGVSWTLEKRLLPGSLLLRCECRNTLVNRLLPDLRPGLRLSINGLVCGEWHRLSPGRHSLVVHEPPALPDEALRITATLLEPPVPSSLLSLLQRPLLRRSLLLHRLLLDEHTVWEAP